MTRPIFGDKAAIERVDPYRVLLHDGLDLPVTVLCCEECNGQLHVEFDDYWVKGDRFGAMTLRWYCTTEFTHDQYYEFMDQVDDDEKKIVKWIQSQYPTFTNEW